MKPTTIVLLTSWRFPGAGLNEDGIQGPATWGAISEFQRVNGLTVDAIAGTATWPCLSTKCGNLRRRVGADGRRVTRLGAVA